MRGEAVTDAEFDTLDAVEQIEEKLREVADLIDLLRKNQLPEGSDLEATLESFEYQVGRLREDLARQSRESRDPAKRSRRRSNQ